MRIDMAPLAVQHASNHSSQSRGYKQHTLYSPPTIAPATVHLFAIHLLSKKSDGDSEVVQGLNEEPSRKV